MIEEARDVSRLLGDRAVLDAALREGAREALRVHRDAGLPLAVWRDGRTEWVSPEEFERLLDARAASGHRSPLPPAELGDAECQPPANRKPG